MEMPPKHVRFTHTPLNFRNKEIRLLTIEPSSEPESPIQITIKHVDFSGHIDALARCQEEIARLQAREDLVTREQKKAVCDGFGPVAFDFVALSYTWGPESPAHDILVTSPNCQGWLSVRQNLYDFLTIRRDCGSAWFWIDQICINQGKDDEKTHQVNQMADIYSAASVEVWLGSGFEGSDELVDLIARESILSAQHPRPKFSVNKQEMSIITPSLSCLLRNSYWLRLWVTQEIVLGRLVDIRVGSKTLPWDTFYSGLQRVNEAWKNLGRTDEYSDAQFTNIRIRVMDRGRNSGYEDWFDIFLLVESTECSDLRDRVFGTMGMVRPSLRILPDYSMRPQDVIFMLLPKIIEGEYAENGNSNDPVDSDRQRTSCIYTALFWLRELEKYESRINRSSVRHHLVKILPLDPPKFGCRIGRIWQLKCYLWYMIPKERGMRWQLRRAVKQLKRRWEHFRSTRSEHTDSSDASSLFADSDSL